MGPLKVLGHVTLIVAVPLLGGAIAGIIIDSLLGTTPRFIIGGFVVGNLIAVIGIWIYIRTARPRGDRKGGAEDTSERP